MTTEIMVVIGLGFFITIITTAVLAKANKYWKNRDPFDGELPLEQSTNEKSDINPVQVNCEVINN